MNTKAIDKLAKLMEKAPERKEELARAILSNKYTRKVALAGAISSGNMDLAFYIMSLREKTNRNYTISSSSIV